MPLELRVLGRNDRLAQPRRHLVVGDDDTALRGKFADDFPPRAVDARDGARSVIVQRRDLRQVAGKGKEHAGDRSQQGRENEQQHESGASRQFDDVFSHCRLPIADCRSADCRLAIGDRLIGDCRMDWRLSNGLSIADCGVRASTAGRPQSRLHSAMRSAIAQSSIRRSAIAQSSIAQSSDRRSSIAQSSIRRSSIAQSSIRRSSIAQSSIRRSAIANRQPAIRRLLFRRRGGGPASTRCRRRGREPGRAARRVRHRSRARVCAGGGWRPSARPALPAAGGAAAGESPRGRAYSVGRVGGS